ncbi:MAG: histidine--tRNA ligase [Erysipelotrichaceae bacterium]|jgi:histidyl-tRNA synthetase|nr:histidine--tRNA ligase [Erysipelotrichaceae bacterium]
MAIQKIKGTKDWYGVELQANRELQQWMRALCELYGYKEVETPEFEKTEVFKREGDSSDVVNKEMYTFMDAGNRSLTLRPEGTAGIMRAIVENKLYAQPDLPLKVFYISSCFRAENPQKGRLRLFHQFGAEALGVKSPVLDAELICLAKTLLDCLEIEDYKIVINSIGDSESRKAYREVLRKHFEPVLGELCEDCKRRYIQNPLRILDCKVDHEHPALVNAPVISQSLNQESTDYFAKLRETLTRAGVEYEIDERLVRGLDYYTDTVFEFLSTNPGIGAQSALGGGGRYDDLLAYFGGPAMSGVGFGMGIERLLIALAEEGKQFEEESSCDLYLMCLDEALLPEALALATQLRNWRIRVQMDFQARSMKSQFKSAERSGAKIIAFYGEEEARTGSLKFKNVDTQEQVTISDPEGWIDQIYSWLQEPEEEEHEHHDAHLH